MASKKTVSKDFHFPGLKVMEFKWSDLEGHGKFKFCLVNYLLQMTKQGHCTIETVDTIVCVC